MDAASQDRANGALPRGFLKSLLVKSGSGFLSGAFGVLAAVSASVTVSRTMGAAAQGEIHLMLALNALVTFSTSLGVGLSNFAYLPVRELTLARANRVAVFVALAFGGGAAAIGMLLRSLGVDFWGTVPLRIQWMGYAAVPFTMYASFWSSLMIGTNRVHLGFWGTGGLAYSGSAAIVASSIWFRTIEAVAWSWAAATALLGSSLLAVTLLLSRGDPPDRRPFLDEVKRSIGFGLSGYWGGVATLLWTRLDSWMLSRFGGTSQVGIYSLAVGIGDKVRTASTPLSYSMMYQVARLGSVEARRLTLKMAALCAAALCVPVLVISFGSPILIRALYGPEFGGAARPLSMLVLGAFFGSLAGCFTPYYVAHLRRPGVLSAVAWLTVVLEAGVGITLIPRLGMVGAAVTTAGVQAFGLALVVGLIPFLTPRIRDDGSGRSPPANPGEPA